MLVAEKISGIKATCPPKSKVTTTYQTQSHTCSAQTVLMAISNKKGTTWNLTQLEICETSDLSHCCTIHAVFSAFPLKMHYWGKKLSQNKKKPGH